MLKLPVFGTLVRKVAVARFTRTLGTLVQSGVPILDGLRITARTAGNKVVEKAVLQCRAAVTEGKTLAEPLKHLRRVPAHGHPDDLGRRADGRPRRDAVARSPTSTTTRWTPRSATLTSLLEPIMIVFLGVVVGGLVVAMYLPIFKLVTLVK